MTGLVVFCTGAAVAKGIFLYSLVRNSGARALPVIAVIFGRALVKAVAITGYYFVLGVILLGVILTPVFLLTDELSLIDIPFFNALFGIVILLLFLLAPVVVFCFVVELRSHKMYVSSSIDVHSAALILGIFFAGMWLNFDPDLAIFVLTISFFLLASLCSTKSERNSASVTGLERWVLCATFFISLYVLISLSFDSLAALFLGGYMLTGLLLRLLVMFLPQHSQYFGKYGPYKRRLWRELVTRLVVFCVSGAAVVVNYYTDAISMTVLIWTILVLADVLVVRSQHGYASVAFDWEALKKAKTSSVWSTVKLISIR